MRPAVPERPVYRRAQPRGAARRFGAFCTPRCPQPRLEQTGCAGCAGLRLERGTRLVHSWVLPTPKRRLTRWALAVAGFVAAGATLNVLVAWGCMLWSPVTWTVLPVVIGNTKHWNPPVVPEGVTMPMQYQESGIGVTGTRTEELAHARVWSGGRSSGRFAAGWPWICLEWGWTGQERHDTKRILGFDITPPKTASWYQASGLDVRFMRPRSPVAVWAARVSTIPIPNRMRLPIDPLWRPLLANTAIWSAIVTGLVLGVRSRRVGAGQCPRCRYPIGVSEVCTECGAAIPAQRRPAAP